LYIDVDDTIIAEINKGSGFDLRPNVMSQLRALTRLFRCRWLTYWPSKEIFKLMKLLYGARINQEMQWVDWRSLGPFAEKADTVLLGDLDFYWLEDPLLKTEIEKLEKANLLDRYVRVEPKGPHGFALACQELFQRAGITANDLKAVGCSMDWFACPEDDLHESVQAA
jgi:hypothetical protein